MIVAVTGTGPPFPRLIAALADYARTSGERVWVQHGPAELATPLEGASFLPRAELLDRMAEADVIVTHAGSGSIADSFRSGGTPVIVPRRAAHGEIVDDHQLELVEALNKEGRVVAVLDLAELPAAIRKASGLRHTEQYSEPGDALKTSLVREVRRRSSDRSLRTRLVWRLFGVAARVIDPQPLARR